jgi:queuosine precursor transporter
VNEAIFFTHAFIVLLFALGALRLGRGALISFIALQAVMANLFVLKQISLFGIEVTCGDLYAVGAMLALNFVREYHGQKEAQRAIWISFGGALLFTIMSQVHLLYLPSENDWAHPSYINLLRPMPRLMGASLFSYLISQQVDLRLFGWLKKSFPYLPLMVRAGSSLVLSQLLDTLLFSFVGLWGMVSSVWGIVVVSYLIKLITIAALIPVTVVSKKVVKAV